MAKSSREYWRDREEAQRRHDITDEAEYRREIERIYRQMMNEMQKELSDFYVKYATKNGITLSEAKRRAKRLDMQAYAEKAKEYVKNRDFSAQANAEMELYNMTMKANRLELLKAELGMHVVGGYDEIQKYFEDKLSDRTLEEFRRQGGILAETVQANGELIDSIVNASFHHATFSERIWGQYAGFKAALDREITHGLIQGIGAEQLARNIQKTCVGVSARDALRLMVTEMTRVRTEAARRSMERNGNTEYEFMALGRHPCPVCKGLNGKIFKLKDLMPGENAPPMHPWCHCSTAPHWDEETYQAWLDSGAAKAGVPFEEFSKIKETGEKERLYSSYPNTVQTKALDAPGFVEKFQGITGIPDVDNAIYKCAVEMLRHRNGTDFEDLYLIDADTGDLVHKLTTCNIPNGVDYDDETLEAIEKAHAEGRRILAIHNHPGGLPPSLDDGCSIYRHGYERGVVIGHNLELYTYGSADADYSPEECEEVHKDIAKAIMLSIDFEDDVWYDYLKEFGMEVSRI